MKKQEQEGYIHLVNVCVDRLNSAWRTLGDIKNSGDHPLVGPAFRFALVQYAVPYTNSLGSNGHRKLQVSCVPVEFRELHHRILTARDTIHAHADLTVMDAKLTLTEIAGKPSPGIISNYIHGLEELENIDQIILLIEGTLRNLYKKRDQYFTEL